MYATVGPAVGLLNDTASEKYKNRLMGVLTLDISDFDKIQYTITNIANEDKCGFSGGDPQPTVIEQFGDCLVLGSDDKGLAVFKIGDGGYPVYVKTESVCDHPIHALKKLDDSHLLVCGMKTDCIGYIFEFR